MYANYIFREKWNNGSQPYLTFSTERTENMIDRRKINPGIDPRVSRAEYK